MIVLEQSMLTALVYPAVYMCSLSVELPDPTCRIRSAGCKSLCMIGASLSQRKYHSNVLQLPSSSRRSAYLCNKTASFPIRCHHDDNFSGFSRHIGVGGQKNQTLTTWQRAVQWLRGADTMNIQSNCRCFMVRHLGNTYWIYIGNAYWNHVSQLSCRIMKQYSKERNTCYLCKYCFPHECGQHPFTKIQSRTSKRKWQVATGESGIVFVDEHFDV